MQTLDSTHADSTLGLGGPSQDPRPELVVVHHPSPERVGARRPVRPGERVELGRASLAFGEGAFHTKRCSRRHCALSYDDGALVVEDLGSRNGTWVNGERTTRAALKPQDLLIVGDVLLIVEWCAPSPPGVELPAGLIAESAAMRALVRRVVEVAPRRSPVLIQGETGTGKERLARLLHSMSGRRGAFQAVNCGAMDDGLLRSELFGHVRGAFSGAERARPGLFRSADGGTLLLDEIGDASSSLQASLLRVLQEGEVRPVGGDQAHPVDTRVLAASHVDLEQAAVEGRFREDLLARLSAWELEIPPLRARRVDVLPLARACVARHAGRALPLRRRLAIALLLHPWPRNVRQLEALMERLVVAQPEAERLDLHPSSPELGVALAAAPRESGERPDAAQLAALLRHHEGNVKACAAALGVSRNTLYRWLRQAGVDPAGGRG